MAPGRFSSPGPPHLISHSELEFVVSPSLQEAVDVHMKPEGGCGASTGVGSGCCQSSQPLPCPFPSLRTTLVFYGKPAIRKPLPESPCLTQPGDRERAPFIGNEGPQAIAANVHAHDHAAVLDGHGCIPAHETHLLCITSLCWQVVGTEAAEAFQ